MCRIWNVLRSRTAAFAVAISGGLLLLGGGAAMAQSVLLPPGGTLVVPPTTAATEPALAGVVLHDPLVPFTIMDSNGAVLCAGNLQDRVVRSTMTHRLDFYYRIRDTQGLGTVAHIATSGFDGVPLRVAYRTDGLGFVPPRLASRNPAPVVTFEFNPPLFCAIHEESRFILIRTPAKAYHAGGLTRLVASTGAGVSVHTVRP